MVLKSLLKMSEKNKSLHNKSKQTECNGLTYPKKQSRGRNCIKVKSTFTQKRHDVTKWNGWGYIDSYFYVENGIAKFSGDRYLLCHKNMPYLNQFLDESLGVTIEDFSIPTDIEFPSNYKIQKSRVTEKQLEALNMLQLNMSTEDLDRLSRSHGQTPCEVYELMHNNLKRLPDVVVWVTCHEDVVELVKICDEENIVIIPYGGGTNVTLALECPSEELRTILSLDTSMMNEILWVDDETLLACCESGILGQDLERELNKIGYTVGHEPDSIEFSSLGGWVSTRASGMKKNTYGNIEDLVVNVRMVTPRGVLEKINLAPRISCGPDFNHVIMGSEGCFGVVTEVTVKIRPVSTCMRYGSLVFPDFASGTACFREIAKQQCQPASLRLMDNSQFQLGRALREEATYFQSIIDGMSKFYLTKIKGYDFEKIAVATIKYEDDEESVNVNEKKINAIAARYGGFPSGSHYGETGYKMTFAIAYLRDMAFYGYIFGDTFETSVSWSNLLPMVENTIARAAKECERFNILHHVVMYRLAQVYDAGACIYFYLIVRGNNEVIYHLVDEILDTLRDTIIESGGSISHHHGVGKVRKKWYKDAVSPVGLNLFRACKNQMDPNNIFAVSNLVNDLKSVSLQSGL